MAFSFLDLPPEIREKIYTIVVISPTLPIHLDAPDAHTHFPLNLLLLCHQTYHESRPLYFSANSFAITLSRRNQDLSYFLSPAFLSNRRQIRSFRLTIDRWGRGDWFVSTFAPAIEDCIMHGALRDLDVRVRKNNLFTEYSTGGRKDMDEGAEGKAVAYLLRLCRDPYLERVKLQEFSLRQDGLGWVKRDLKDITRLLDRSSLASSY